MNAIINAYTRNSLDCALGMLSRHVFGGGAEQDSENARADAWVPVQILYQVFNGARPHMPEGLPAGYKQLIEDCWHSDHTARPTFVAIHERLRSLYQELQPPRQPAAAAAAAAASGRS